MNKQLGFKMGDQKVFKFLQEKPNEIGVRTSYSALIEFIMIIKKGQNVLIMSSAAMCLKQNKVKSQGSKIFDFSFLKTQKLQRMSFGNLLFN